MDSPTSGTTIFDDICAVTSGASWLCCWPRRATRDRRRRVSRDGFAAERLSDEHLLMMRVARDADPSAGLALRGRATRRTVRPPDTSVRCGRTNSHAPMFSGSSWTHTTSPASGKASIAARRSRIGTG